jgi:hypothetical protein
MCFVKLLERRCRSHGLLKLVSFCLHCGPGQEKSIKTGRSLII